MKDPKKHIPNRKNLLQKAIKILCSLDNDYPGSRKIEWIYQILLELKNMERKK